MIDTAKIRIVLYNEYQETMHQESWRSFEHFLLVKILRLTAGQPWLRGVTEEYHLQKSIAELEAKLERLDVEMLTTDDEGNPVGCSMDLLDWQAHLQTELGVEKLRTRELEEFKRKVYEAYTPGKHCRVVDLEQVLLEEIGNED